MKTFFIFLIILLFIYYKIYNYKKTINENFTTFGQGRYDIPSDYTDNPVNITSTSFPIMDFSRDNLTPNNTQLYLYNNCDYVGSKLTLGQSSTVTYTDDVINDFNKSMKIGSNTIFAGWTGNDFTGSNSLYTTSSQIPCLFSTGTTIKSGFVYSTLNHYH